MDTKRITGPRTDWAACRTGLDGSDMVRRLLAYLYFRRCQRRLPQIAKTEAGKPYLCTDPSCFISLSHTAGAVSAADPRFIPGAVRRGHDDVAAWAGCFAGREVVVVCQKGLKLSQGAAAWLRHAGANAESLEGGFEAWRDARLPLVAPAHVPPRDAQGRTVWVTRARPKVDRIACPWLIRRFVDPDAVFLFVAPPEVTAVAERFGATPFERGTSA